MIKKIHMLTYFIVIFSLLSIGYTCSYFSDTETNTCMFTAWIDEPCTRSQGYWKTHDEAWPMDEIIVGGHVYTKAEAINWLKTPVQGDMTVVMFYQLVPAKLNVAAGCEASCITDIIADADDWMTTYGPVGNGVQEDPPSPWETGEPLKNTLDQYNNGELCAPHCDNVVDEYYEGSTRSEDTWRFTTNHLPDMPNLISPVNDSLDIELSPTLKVQVFDRDGNSMNVSFYDASNNQLIGQEVNIVDGENASITWDDLSYSHTYRWHVIVNDSMIETQSDTWCFTTIAIPPSGGGGSKGSSSGGGSPPSNNPPIADAGGPYSSGVLETVLCNGSTSFDPDGTIVLYFWDFGDGTNATGTNATTTHQYTDVGTYTVTLMVTDNDGATDINTTIVIITSLLEIINITTTPNIQNMGEHVNITCSITNTSQVVDVFLNISYPNNNSTIPSMYQNNIENSTTYYLNQTYTLLGTYTYYIWACDTENHITISETYQFSIMNFIDLIPPEISNISANPEEQEISGYINITATVIDNNGVKDVFLNITNPDNSTVNIIMNCIDGTVIYYYNSTYSNYGEYIFFIFATDTSNNTAKSNISHFSIVEEDMQPPEIVDNTSGIAYKNHSFTFNSTVTDNNIVACVYVEHWYETENHTNVSMDNINEDGWNKTIMIPSNFDILQYIIHARDTFNNWNHTGVKSVSLLEYN